MRRLLRRRAWLAILAATAFLVSQSTTAYAPATVEARTIALPVARTANALLAAPSGPVLMPPGNYTFTAGPNTGGSPYPGTAQGRNGGQDNKYSAFNYGQFTALYWGPFNNPSASTSNDSTSGVAVTFDGTDVDPAIAQATGEVLTFSSGTSNLAGGIARWTGSAVLGGSLPVPTRLTLTVTNMDGQPIPFIDATTLGLSNGAVIRVVRNYNVKVLFEAQYTPSVWTSAIAGFDAVTGTLKTPTTRIWTWFKGGFFYETGPQVFSDEPPSDWAYSQINEVFQRGVTTGCYFDGVERRYCPDANVTRDQMAAFLIRAKGLTEYANPTPTFSDVPASYWAYGWIERLYQQGITTGCYYDGVERRYCPTGNVTRDQMAAFLMRAKGLTEYANPTPTFSDVPASYWAYGWIERLYAQAVTTGCYWDGVERRYCPVNNVTRREMAVFITRNWP